MIRSFLVALQLLTIIPLKKDLNITDKLLLRSTIFFPVVGLLIGGIQVLIFLSFHHVLTPSVMALIILLISVVTTGALHMEGFADTVDGFLSRKDKKETLKIMRDSHVGAMGAIGVTCLILAKFILFREIVDNPNPSLVMGVLLLVPCLSRWAIVISTGVSKYARPGPGLGCFAERVTKKQVLISGTAPIAGALILSLGFKQNIIYHFWEFILIIATILLALLLSRWAKRKVGGITGDILGGINEIAEVILFLSVVMIASFS